MDKKKYIIGAVVIVAGYLLYKKLYKKDTVTKDTIKIEDTKTNNERVTKWEDLDVETVKKKAKEIRVGVNKTINANINKTPPTGDMLGLFPNGININWDKADLGNPFPNYG